MAGLGWGRGWVKKEVLEFGLITLAAHETCLCSESFVILVYLRGKLFDLFSNFTPDLILNGMGYC